MAKLHQERRWRVHQKRFPSAVSADHASSCSPGQKRINGRNDGSAVGTDRRRRFDENNRVEGALSILGYSPDCLRDFR